MRPAAPLLPLFLFAASTFADDAKPRTITTTGTGKMQVVPDEIDLLFSVRT